MFDEWDWWQFSTGVLIGWFIVFPAVRHVWHYYWRGRKHDI